MSSSQADFLHGNDEEEARRGRRRRTVCVTGASGFLGSHIVSELLARNYRVHGTVRDVHEESKTAHLRALPGARNNLSLFPVDFDEDDVGVLTDRFDEALEGCFAVIHAACPMVVHDDCIEDGKERILRPALRGTEAILDAIERQTDASAAHDRGGQDNDDDDDRGCCIETFVLTSSMAAISPKPPPPFLTEKCWSDPDAQRRKGQWYYCAKTMQERLVEQRLSSMASSSKGRRTVRFVSICPTWIFGPSLQPTLNATMERLADLFNGGKDRADNGSMCFVDVRDCAAVHVAALEKPSASGRFMCLSGMESNTTREDADGSKTPMLHRGMHWNDVFRLMKEIHPTMPDVQDCEGEPVRPKHYDLTRMNTLMDVSTMRDVQTILTDSLDDLRKKGSLCAETSTDG